MSKYDIANLEDLTPIVYQVLQENNFKNVKLVFPQGKYHFHPDKAFGKYHHITNHDNSYKYFAFPLVNGKNIEIDGQGSEFIFHGIITPFLVENSENVVLRNFSIDWEVPFYVQGTVVARNEKEMTMDIRFNDESMLKHEGDRLIMTSNGQNHAILGEDMVFDPERRAVVYRAEDYLIHNHGSKFISAQKLEAPNTYRLKAPFTQKPAPEGLVYVFKGEYGNNRLAPAIHVTDSKGFTANHINIYHAGGMGVIGEKSEDIYLDNVNIKLQENSERLVTTTADATHFCNCKGDLIIENCLFENMLDDATNVHGTYLKIFEILGSNKLSAQIRHPQQMDYDFANTGDLIQLVDGETLLPLEKNELKQVTKINNGYYILEFKNNFSGNLKTGDGLENITWYPVLTFRNNVVRNNRARSILISTRNKTLIENNTFSSMMTSILFEGDLNYWHESGAVEDVTVRNNVFYDNAYGGAKASVIWINPQMKRIVPDQPYEHNIRIENNEFRTFDRSILDAKSVGGLVFKGNKIIQSTTFEPIWANRHSVELSHCVDAVISDNTYEGEGQFTIQMDEESKKTASVDNKTN